MRCVVPEELQARAGRLDQLREGSHDRDGACRRVFQGLDCRLEQLQRESTHIEDKRDWNRVAHIRSPAHSPHACKDVDPGGGAGLGKGIVPAAGTDGDIDRPQQRQAIRDADIDRAADRPGAGKLVGGRSDTEVVSSNG